MENLSQYLPLINSIVIALGGITVVLIYIFSNRNNVSKTVIDNYKTLDDQKTRQIEDLKKDVQEIKATMRVIEKGFIERISKLEGQLKEKDNQIRTLNEILSNRNPELEKILGEIHEFMKQLVKSNSHQTEMMESSQNRNDRIDSATDNETGNVLRKE